MIAQQQQQQQQQSTTLPALRPSYILRGHAAQIHTLRFLRANSRLLTGDADGWLVLWDFVSKRPVGAWRAHEGGILGTEAWAADKIVSHGRDNRVRVWQLGLKDEAGLSRDLPVDVEAREGEEPKRPWMLCSVVVNSLNFCAFSLCAMPRGDGSTNEQHEKKDEEEEEEALIAAPGSRDAQVNIYHLPSGALSSIVPPSSTSNTTTGGLLMALHLFRFTPSSTSTSSSVSSSPTTRPPLCLLTAHESGLVLLHRHDTASNTWHALLTTTPSIHSQPILSLALEPSHAAFYTSGADDVIARHPIPNPLPAHVGTGVAMVLEGSAVTRTRHAGQQSLAVRGDGRVLAAAGWDGRGRVYAWKKGKGVLREMAVLRYHGVGCYAVAFAEVLGSEPRDDGASDGAGAREEGGHGQVVKSAGGGSTVQQRRDEQVRGRHWIAVGAKDGKVSIWDVY